MGGALSRRSMRRKVSDAAGGTVKNACMTRAGVIARLKAAEPRIRAHGVAALYLYG